MFGIGMPELLLILAIALIVIGPKKLPDLAKSLGRAMGEFKRATNDLKDSIQKETGLDEVRDTFKGMNADIIDAASDESSIDSDTPPDNTDTEPTSPLEQVGKAFQKMNQESPDTATETPTESTTGDETPPPQEKAAP
jgi:sec-independent protein translocase protein TatB